MLNESLHIAADSIGVGILGANNAAVLSVGAITMTLDDEAVLDLERTLAVIVPLGYLPCFSRRQMKIALAVWTVR